MHINYHSFGGPAYPDPRRGICGSADIENAHSGVGMTFYDAIVIAFISGGAYSDQADPEDILAKGCSIAEQYLERRETNHICNP